MPSKKTVALENMFSKSRYLSNKSAQNTIPVQSQQLKISKGIEETLWPTCDNRSQI